MVRFRQRLDRNRKIYIPKPLREAGFNTVIEIIPDTHAAAIYPAGADLREVVQSLEIILQDLKLQVKAPQDGGCRQ
ncbi:MAG: hypothetical protein QXX94_07555 [Candidatus Bathyarchaeia archaeon]